MIREKARRATAAGLPMPGAGVLRRHVARGLVVALTGVSALALAASPAQAFTFDGTCSGLLNGERHGFFIADNGDAKGSGVWQWNGTNTPSGYTYRLWAVDHAPGDSASMITEVVAEDGRSIPYQNKENYYITFKVRQYRFVWNGYPSSWFAPTSCLHATN